MVDTIIQLPDTQDLPKAQEAPTVDKRIEISVLSNGDLTLGLSKQNFKNHEFYGMLIATMVELIVSNLKTELINSFSSILLNAQAETPQIPEVNAEREAIIDKVSELKSQLEGLLKNI